MPGIGSYPAGHGAAGIDPVTALLVPHSAFATKAPRALQWDSETRDFAQTADGRYVAAHPVDAKVDYLLRTPKGSVRSNPEIGETITAIRYIEPAKAQAEVEDRVRLALTDPLSKGEIALGRIIVDARVRGKLLVVIHYVNLVTAQPGHVNVSVDTATG